MKLALRLAALVCILLLPVTGWSMQPLPLAPEAASNAAIGEPLKGLLEDYVKLLPEQTSLQITEPEQGYLTHSWSRNYDALAKACQADQLACAALMRAQFDVLLAELNKQGPNDAMDLRRVLLMTAEYDLCQIGGTNAMGYRCLNPNLTTMISLGWRVLGYEHLFLAFHEADLAYRNQWEAWVVAQTDLTPTQKQESLKRTERDAGAPERDAYGFELRGNLSAAYTSWLIILYQRMDKADAVLVSLTNLARLAALQGELEQAEQWWKLVERTLSEHPELQQGTRCLVRSQRFHVDLLQAKQAGSPFDGMQRVQELIGGDCPFTTQALTFALQMKEREPNQVSALLKLVQESCQKSGTCAHDRHWQICKLAGLAGDRATLLAEDKYWLGRLKRFDLLGNERKLVWQLADRLRETGALAEAAELYQKLDDDIEFFRNQIRFNNPADLAEFDGLKRARVRAELEQGKQIMPLETESLRGQSLLKRLRVQRWMKELAGVRDAEAKAELDGQMKNIRELRAMLVPAIPALPPLMQAIAKAMLADSERSEQEFQLTYLDKLATKKLEAEGQSGWGGLDTYKRSQDSAWVAPVIPFDKNEAYLSWLRVPGGYIGTLLGTDPKKPDHYLYGAHNNIRQLFIPFTRQDEAVLRLYRDLLQSGASVERGFKRTQPLEGDAEGLRLNGAPVWQLADGSFVTSPTVPANGRRVKNLAELSDALYQRLLAPFASASQDAQRLIISPDGELAYLPFETLTRKGVPVLEITDIGYVQSLAVYAELKKRVAGRKQRAAASLLSVADPKYVNFPDGAAEQQGRLARIQWPALPGTRKESAALTALYRNSRQMLGADASKAGLTRIKDVLVDYRMLHFATHGYVDDERSALVLSPEKDALSAYLLDQDIVGWKLDSDMVLLSACNTGIGRQQTGEGIVGLPYAFFMAGNINTLMSLWPVDDEGTAKLMPAYMQRIQQGEDHVTALNNTKRAFARGDYGPAFKNPRIWAAFVLYGVPLAGQ